MNPNLEPNIYLSSLSILGMVSSGFSIPKAEVNNSTKTTEQSYFRGETRKQKLWTGGQDSWLGLSQCYSFIFLRIICIFSPSSLTETVSYS